VAILATTLGGIFPDGDAVFGWFEGNNLATLELHRGWTHSFVCLPILALLFAALTRWVARRFNWACPSLAFLTLAYAAGLACHILLDLITSFGTMIWSPLSNVRAVWDLAFILDFVLSAIVLLPQLAAWVYQPADADGRWLRRTLVVWTLPSIGAVVVWWLARSVGVGFSEWVLAIAALLLAAIFFLPAVRGWGFTVSRAVWCRAGVVALAAYLGLCAFAHDRALVRVEQFAASRGLTVETIGALPAPPSLSYWTGLIRTPEGVYQARINLFQLDPPAFRFLADSPSNAWLDAARQLPAVKTYLWFARFPVFRQFTENGRAVVEMADLRFFTQRRGPTAFTYRVEFDPRGHVLAQGWVREAIRA
jgi:membrane-bound metal-dependent hydrolase YbcI (DUF457 family)